MLRHSNTMSVAVAAVLAIVLPGTGTCQSQMTKALSMLPADTSITIAADLNAFSNPKSLFNLISRQDLATEFSGSLGRKSEATDSVSAMLLVALRPDRVDKFDVIASGIRGLTPDGDPMEEFGVLQGRFTKAEALGMLKSCQVKAGPGTAGIFPTEPGVPSFYVTVPSDNIILISTTTAWFDDAGKFAETKTGLLSPASGFMGSLGAFGGRMPDAFMHWEGSAIRTMMEGSDSAKVMFGPILAGKGHVLAVFASDVPTLELHTTFADEGGVAGFKNGIGIYLDAQNRRLEQLIQNSKTARKKASYEEQMEFYKGLQVDAVGPVGVLRCAFSKPPTGIQAKNWAMTGLGVAMKSDNDNGKQAAPPAPAGR